jgi:hypothetical protein
MEERLDKYLYKKYPELFKNESKSMKETCMCWGCTCGDGWIYLLDNLCAAITAHIKYQHSQVDYYDDYEKTFQSEGASKPYRPDYAYTKIEQVHFEQVKEYFGSLRVYYTGGDETVMNMVDFAERLSESICEECGKFDYSVGRTQKGWIRSLCRECSKNDERKREWKVIDTELEEVFKLAMKDKEENKDKKLDMAFKKIEELKLRDKPNAET